MRNSKPIVAVVGIDRRGFNLSDAVIDFQKKYEGAAEGAVMVATIAARGPDEELRSDFIDALNDIEPNPIFAIPGPNIFMPEDFRLQPLDPDDTKMKNPELVHTDGVVKAPFMKVI